MIVWLYIYLAITTFFTVVTIIYPYYSSANEGEGRYIDVRDVVMSVLLTQVPLINIFGIWVFLTHLYDVGFFDSILDFKIIKERI